MGSPWGPQVRGGRGQRREVRLHPAAPGPFRGEVPAGQSGAMRPAACAEGGWGMTEGEAPQVLVGGVETPLKRDREMYIVYII